ncbi:SigE family RNA polymerase sigma factor [Actinospica durhamensis]|uniref:SigE family RNA polymerase sigma factor n=1 Tax=Actinospica durhamensis TaxID=1508375 RepID=A0A941EZK4_9ACTN|nr:SigE family RNA polymerase sigma factor [Actinospica durhamensis]MBR7838149.1 SigE family RNA polymerase sigma factor [Actinospica durhamensis]
MRETAEFDAFYEATSHRLIGQLFAMTGDLGSVEDAVQDAYVRAWQAWPKIGAYDNPEAWVRSVAYKLLVNAWHKSRNRLTAHWREAARSHPGPELGPDLIVLVQALRRLPERQRRVLVLHYVADLSVEQIVRETGIAAGTVKSHLSRGRQALAPLVSEDDGEGSAGAVHRTAAPEHRGENGSARKEYGLV